MQRNRPGPAHFKAAFAGGSSQERTAQPRSDSTLRPIHHPPSWLETILMRPIRVECWTCLRPSWLHRGQRDATPSDWTCPNCQTHQKRDKDGNIEPVPEMFDSTLNEATSERISRSVRSRNRPYASKNTLAGSKDDIFCEMCSGHQRVVYQLLSNYIPDEDDENYEAFVGNADTYRRQLEERYPLACSNCIDKVQKILAQQNYNIKSSLLNATLNKSRGDAITPTRKYPSAFWMFTSTSWIISHTVWAAIELGALFHLQGFESVELLRQKRYSPGYSTLSTITGLLSKLNIAFMWPWSSVFGVPFKDLQEHELRMVLLVVLGCLSIASLFWDPMQWTQWKSPRLRIRVRWYRLWTQRAAVVLLVFQFLGLLSQRVWQGSTLNSGAMMLLHAVYLMALFTGWQVLEPIELKFSPSATPSTSQELPVDENIRSDNGSSGTKSTTKQHSFSNRSFNPPALSRTASDPSNRFIAPASPSWNDFSGSLSDSQETNQMNWSPKKPLSTPSSRLPAVFGTYRDSSKRTSQDESFIHGMSRLGQDSSSIYTSTFSSSNHDRTNDNKFRARAYEPSPLANPSLITNMSISNISFGEMLGFPSAKFQQPENHFAHRSAPDSNKLEPWALRKPAGTGSGAFGMDRGIHRRGQGSRPSGLSRNADDENERDDEDEDYSYTQRTTFESHGQNTGMEADIFGHSFSAMGRSSQARDGWTVDGREAFAAQTYFPPEPETGLEDNFFGVVKIVDDYLPPKQAPRTIDARNLMIKKRMAKRWLVLIVVCRALSLLQPDGHWLDNLLWASHFIFIAVLLHAAAFWALDESRAFQRYLNQKPVSRTEKTTAAVQPCDPFAPTLLDKICSYALMALLSIRILGLGLTVFNRSTQEASLNGACGHNADLLSHGDGYEYCQDLGNRLNNLDWPFQALQLLPFVKDNGDNLETLASYAGWIHDGLIVVLFGVLIACGAGAPSSPLSPSPGVRKVKK